MPQRNQHSRFGEQQKQHPIHDRQRLIDRYDEIYPGFITIFVADRAGVVHEIYPRRESPPIADREYFIDAVRLRRPVPGPGRPR